jgi:hypothetical protein
VSSAHELEEWELKKMYVKKRYAGGGAQNEQLIGQEDLPGYP